jgi:hypothetical protein
MTVEQLVPRVGVVEVGDLMHRLRRVPSNGAGPFHESRIDFSDAVSRAIFRQSRSQAFGELAAVAFWLRRAAVRRLAARFAALEPGGSLRVPRGFAFHIPPSNVDTVFAYPLIASFLVGNVNLVRVSPSRTSEQVTLLCAALREVLAEERFAGFADELAVVSYSHEAEPTAVASQEADVRLLWGGDEAIESLRSFPIRVGAHELTFGDRFSFAVIRPEAVLDADPPSRYELAERLFNDAYAFDQLACSSPRLLVWVGSRRDSEGARRLLFDDLYRVIADKGYVLTPGASISKLTFLYRALIDRPVAAVHQAGNTLVVLTLSDLSGFDRSHPGAGLLFEARVESLTDLVPFVDRKDQTLTAHGFSQEELTAFARSLQGRGIDRIVEFGDALSFSSLWDGYDLLAELTRTVAIAVVA